MNHVSVSPTNGNGPTQGQKKTLTGWELNRRPSGYIDHRCFTDRDTEVRREQAVGTEDVKVTAMNMYKYKEGLRFCKRWPFLCPCVGPFPLVGSHGSYRVEN